MKETKSKEEIESIKTVLDNLFFYNILDQDKDGAYVVDEENHQYDYVIVKEDGQEIYGEVKKLEEPLYIDDNCFESHLNPYWILGENNRLFTTDGIPDANDKIDISLEHLANYKNHNIPEGFQYIPCYVVNAGWYSKEGEHFGLKDKLSKMMSGNWCFDLVLGGCEIIHFKPEVFKKALGPYIRMWSTHTNKIKNGSKKKSWEFKRLIKLNDGLFMRNVNSMSHSEYLEAVL